MSTTPSFNPSTFNAQILANQDLLFTLAVALLGDRDRAEAAVQQACQAAYERCAAAAGLAVREALLACLVQACSRGWDWRRWGNRRGARSAQAPWLDSLSRLPFKPRAAVALVELAGLSYGEAARVLSCSPGDVRSHLARGRQSLAGAISL